MRKNGKINVNIKTQYLFLPYLSTFFFFFQSWNKFKRRVNNLAFYTALWKSAIKKIKGHFGTSVTSYFLFLKWLFLWNLFSFFIAFCFQVLPQLLYRFFQMKPKGYSNNTHFVGTDLLTGKVSICIHFYSFLIFVFYK